MLAHTPKSSHRQNLIIAFIFILISGTISLIHGRGIGWDFLDYHYYNGYAFIHHRLGIDLAPAGTWSYYNPLLDGLNYLLISSLPAQLATFLMGANCGLITFFLYKITELIFAQTGYRRLLLTLMSCIIAFSAPSIFPSIGSVMNDLQSGTPFIIALYMVLKSFTSKQPNSFLFIAGLFNGLAPALKLTNIDYSFCLILFYLLFNLSSAEQLKSTAMLCLGSALAFILGEGWWMLMLYQHFGNPFFPFFNTLFHSPYYPDKNLIACPSMIAHDLYQAIRIIFILTEPSRKVADVPVQDWRFAFVMVLGLGYLLLQLVRRFHALQSTQNKLINFLSLFWILSFLIYAFALGNYRYTAILQLLSGPLIIAFYNELTSDPSLKLWIKKSRDFGLLLLSAVLITNTVYPNFNYARYDGTHYIQLNVPSTFPNGALVIITQTVMSFVAAFFPQSTRFVTPYVFPENHDLSKQAVMAHRGPIYMLIEDHNGFARAFPGQDWSIKTMGDYHLHFTGPCQIINSNVDWRSTFKLCPVGIK